MADEHWPLQGLAANVTKNPPWIFSWYWLQNNELPESVQPPDATSGEMNHRDVKLVLITNPQLENAMRLWLKRLAAHLWKPMFFNETLVIKWVPWLFRHKTTREDKTMYLIYRVAAPTLFLAISHSVFLSLSLSIGLFSMQSLFLILPLKMSLS